MKPDVMLEELEAACGSLAVRVSYEALNAVVGSGGLCKVKGELRVIVDKRASVGERLATLAQALGRLDTAALELSRPARELLAQFAVRHAS